MRDDLRAEVVVDALEMAVALAGGCVSSRFFEAEGFRPVA